MLVVFIVLFQVQELKAQTLIVKKVLLLINLNKKTQSSFWNYKKKKKISKKCFHLIKNLNQKSDHKSTKLFKIISLLSWHSLFDFINLKA